MRNNKTNDETVVVLGNGFDLDLGLKTSFKSFVEHFRFKEIPQTNLIRRINGENWCDLERLFREVLLQYADNPSEQLCDDICDTWRLIEKGWGTYLPEITELNNVTINKSSCAYAMLRHCKDMTNWFSFNYTSPFYLASLSEENNIHYIHNAFVPREYTPKGCMYLIYKNLIIGVESNDIPQIILDNAKIRHIVKKNNPYFKDCGIIEKFYVAKNIIIFGHSLSVTDSDYFKDFFNDICNNEVQDKTIYIVTYNQESLSELYKNMSGYGIEYSKLTNCKCRIISVYTKDGIGTPFFQQILELIS